MRKEWASAFVKERVDARIAMTLKNYYFIMRMTLLLNGAIYIRSAGGKFY